MKELLSGLVGARAENLDGIKMSCNRYIPYLLLLLPVLTFLLVSCNGCGGGGGEGGHLH